MNQDLSEKVDKANQLFHQANVEIYRLWVNEMLFKWPWWLNAALTVLPWILWIMVRKKDSTHRLLYAGAVVLIVSSFLDAIGMALNLWTYDSKLIPLIPPYAPWDFCVIPVSVMLLIQIKPKVSPFLKAAALSGVGSFVVQPLIEWLGLYNPKSWKHYYSFPIAYVIYLIGHYISKRKSFEKV